MCEDAAYRFISLLVVGTIFFTRKRHSSTKSYFLIDTMQSANKANSSGYCWLVMVAAFLSELIVGLSTYGSLSVLVYMWSEIFHLTTDVAAWSASIMGASFFLTGTYVIEYNSIN